MGQNAHETHRRILRLWVIVFPLVSCTDWSDSNGLTLPPGPVNGPFALLRAVSPCSEKELTRLSLKRRRCASPKSNQRHSYSHSPVLPPLAPAILISPLPGGSCASPEASLDSSLSGIGCPPGASGRRAPPTVHPWLCHLAHVPPSTATSATPHSSGSMLVALVPPVPTPACIDGPRVRAQRPMCTGGGIKNTTFWATELV